MEPLRQQQVTRRAALGGMAFAAFGSVGCFGKHFAKKSTELVKPAAQGRMISTWEKNVVFAPDASRGGAIIPGLMGRMYLFAPGSEVPQYGDGSLKLDLWDSTPHGDTPPRQMEHFIIGADVLRMFSKVDGLGFEGYSIFFPWSTYRPDVTQVYITMLYTAADGGTYFHQSGTFAIDHTGAQERVKKGQSISSPSVNQVSSK